MNETTSLMSGQKLSPTDRLKESRNMTKESIVSIGSNRVRLMIGLNSGSLMKPKQLVKKLVSI